MTERQAPTRPTNDPRTPNDPRTAEHRRPPTDPAITDEPQAHQPRSDQSQAHQAQAPGAQAHQAQADGGQAHQAQADGGQAHQAQADRPPANQLLSGPDLDAVTRRWHDIQAGFVDAPQQAVKDADALVADLMNRLTQLFAAERRQLESQWSRGDQVSTEELRVSLQRYRSFFQRLLSVH
jgi:hypothetical protein